MHCCAMRAVDAVLSGSALSAHQPRASLTCAVQCMVLLLQQRAALAAAVHSQQLCACARAVCVARGCRRPAMAHGARQHPCALHKHACKSALHACAAFGSTFVLFVRLQACIIWQLLPAHAAI